MTDNDKRLIQEASDMAPKDNYMITYMIQEADTDEARKELKRIQVWKYHREEFECGCM